MGMIDQLGHTGMLVRAAVAATTAAAARLTIKECPHHRAHDVVNTVGRIGRRVGLGAPCVERLLDLGVVRIVPRRLPALVLIAHRVAAAALGHENRFVRECFVTRVHLIARL